MGRIGRYVARHHLALLALFVALGGTSLAASNALLPRNSVGTPQLKKGAVTKVKINPKTVKALKGNRGARGATGPQGVQGGQGPTGAAGVPATKLFAMIKGTASGVNLLRSSGVVSATRTNQGEYLITFNRDLAGCVPVIGQGTASAFYDSFVFINEANVSADKVYVTTHNLSGAAVEGEASLAVFC